MKRHPFHTVFSVVLATAILFSAAGIYMTGKIGTIIHQRAVLSNVDSGETVTLELSKMEFKSIHWVGDKDFIFDGKLYDIESFSVVHGVYVLSCEFDHYESGLMSMMNSQLNHDHGTAGKQSVKSTDAGPEFILPINFIAFANTEYTLLNSGYQCSATDAVFVPLAPPPPEA